ncbi:MAG: hybrid sensor histidine kinase/response regulator [Candidatus Brocadiae bacterium]|nr:hybrid sensor histidine kinase/response regulator [Candidatus Brocadiia bacterium]
MIEEYKKTIFIVDDTTEIIDILETILSKDYNIKFALNGEKALKKLFGSNDLPDLILLDIMMPEINGYDVCKRLKENEKTQQIPVIFVSAMDEVDDETKGFNLGAVDYITKPFNTAIVKTRVKTHIELSEARKTLERNNEQLKSVLKLREDMADMIMHDMRNMLGTIMGYSDLLIAKHDIPSKYIKYVQNIHTQSQHLNSFLNDMLIMAKTEKTQLVLNRSLVDLSHIFYFLESVHSIVASSKGIRLVFESIGDPRCISLDVKLFQRVLDNLISNALKFSPPESKVVVKAEYPQLETDKTRIYVIDEGMGIPEEHHNRLFKKFEIIEAKAHGVHQIGFGLAFCKMVVDAHNGNIFVKNNSPTGAVFTIEL